MNILDLSYLCIIMAVRSLLLFPILDFTLSQALRSLLLMAVVAAQYRRALLALASVLLPLLLRMSPSASPLVAEAQHLSFSIQLTHRDSQISPLFNASETTSGRLANALRRSAKRVQRFKEAAFKSSSDSDTPQSLITATGDGDYLMNLSLGTPPVQMLAIFDTGSDLVWTQCASCYECFDQPTPFFNPKASSTFQNVTCDSGTCLSLNEDAWCESSSCQYTYSYGDGSFTRGIVATDTVTLGSTSGQPFSLEGTTFGCGTDNAGYYDGTGIVGFGQGPASLFSRMKDLIDDQFSYCLTPSTSNHVSKFNFGSNSEVSGTAVQSTPMFSGEVDTFYYITLESISLESDQMLTSTSSSGTVPMIIDSGTTFTYLPQEMYDSVVASLRKLIPSEPVDDPTEEMELCYKSDAKLPKIVMHFTGANVTLSDLNSFWETSEDVLCFAFLPSDDLSSIYGNTQQANFLIGYDLKGKHLSFRKADCTEY